MVSMARRVAQKRHPIAHHIWAYCDELPDALLLIDPAASLQAFVEISKSLNKTSALDANNPLFEPDSNRIMVYREKDLSSIITEMKTVAMCISHMINLVHGHHPAPHQMLDLLNLEPLFQAALSSVRKKRNQASSAAQPPEASA
ncbi:hypothetical protein ACQPTN_23810 [Bradyrhizobium sp. 13971]